MADISAIKLPDGMTYNLVDKTSGYITNYTETDPIFSASAAHGISTADITNWNSKQAALVSGTNIKTINNQSILGSGNIDVDNIFIVDIGSSTYNDIYQAYIDGKTLFAKDSNGCIDSYKEYWLSFTNYNPSDDMITFSSILDGYEAWASIDIVDNWQYGRAIITPAWAKASTKPTYTASEVGALPASTVIPTNTSDLVNDSGFIDSSVLSVVATSGDYNDLSNKPTIPTSISDLTNDLYETGTATAGSVTWKYRKWANGELEMWGSGITTLAINTAVGNIYTTANEYNIAVPSFVDSVDFVTGELSGGGWVDVTSYSVPPKVRFYAPTAYTSTNRHLRYYLKGSWV